MNAATPLTGIRALPEPGQIVEVRRRRWVVSDIEGRR